MPVSLGRRLAIDLIPAVLAIGYGVVEPMMGIIAEPVGLVLLAWAGLRNRSAGRSKTVDD